MSVDVVYRSPKELIRRKTIAINECNLPGCFYDKNSEAEMDRNIISQTWRRHCFMKSQE